MIEKDKNNIIQKDKNNIIQKRGITVSFIYFCSIGDKLVILSSLNFSFIFSFISSKVNLEKKIMFWFKRMTIKMFVFIFIFIIYHKNFYIY